jgi:hypothetical protein
MTGKESTYHDDPKSRFHSFVSERERSSPQRVEVKPRREWERDLQVRQSAWKTRT